MKLIWTFILIIICFNPSFAQLGDGEISPNFELDDLDGNSHELYDYLEQGYAVIMDCSATWCSFCWNYHQSGILEELWELYGPDGTDQIRVFFVEAESASTQPCIYGPIAGCTGGSKGDWTLGVEYPILNPTSPVAQDIYDDFDLSFYPTLYGISPDKRIYLVGQASVSEWETWLIESFQMIFSTANKDDTSCESSLIEINVSGGYGQIEYEWSNGSDNEAIYNIENGEYYVTITDENDFDFELGPILIDNQNYGGINIIETIDLECYNDLSGFIEVEMFGGSGDFSFQWSNGNDSPINQNLEAGDYELTVLDNISDCEFEEFFILEQPDDLYVGYELENPSCESNSLGSVDFLVEGGIEPYLFEFPEFETNESFISLQAGFYDVTVSDDNLCQVFIDFSILSENAPIADLESSGNLNCLIDTVYLHADSSSIGNNIDYHWYDPNFQYIDSSYQIQIDSAGMYTLEVIDNTTQCSSFDSIYIFEFYSTPQAIAISSNDLNCNYDSSLISAVKRDSDTTVIYSWSTQDGQIPGDTNFHEIIISTAGSYVLTALDTISNCISLDTAIVEQIPDPEIIFSSLNLEFCADQENPICILLNSNESAEWSIEGDIVGSEACISINSSSMLSLEITNSITNCSITEDLEITAYNNPIIYVALPEILSCNTSEAILDLTTDDPESLVSWYNAQSDFLSDEEDLIVDQAGTYFVHVTNIYGCSSSLEVDVQADPDELPVSDFNFQMTALDFEFINDSKGNIESYLWDFGDGSSSSEENPSHSYDLSAYYLVCLSCTNECGTSTECEEILARTGIQLNSITEDISCYSYDDGTISLSVMGGLPPFEFEWDGPDGKRFENPITNLSAGIYHVSITDAAEFSYNESFEILEPEAVFLEAIINPTSGSLSNGSIMLTIEGGVGAYQIEWSNGSTSQSISNLEAGEYKVVVTDQNACSEEATYIIENTTSLIEIESLISFNIYPNPANEILNIAINLENKQKVQLRIISTLGKVHYNEIINDFEIQFGIETSSYPEGVYLIELRTEDLISLKKIIISR